MYTANLRKVGGSVMLAVPPAILEMLQMESGASVSMAVESGRLIIEPNVRKKYSLQELLAQCDPSAPLSPSGKSGAHKNMLHCSRMIFRRHDVNIPKYGGEKYRFSRYPPKLKK